MSITSHLDAAERRRTITALAQMRAQGQSWDQISNVMGKSGEVLARSLFLDMVNGLADQHPSQFAKLGQQYGGDLDGWLRDTAALIAQGVPNTPKPVPLPLTTATLEAVGQRMGQAMAQRIDNPPPPSPAPPDPTVVMLRALRFIVHDIHDQHTPAAELGFDWRNDTERKRHESEVTEQARDIMAELTTALEDVEADV
jgi:hypothetical protein